MQIWSWKSFWTAMLGSALASGCVMPAKLSSSSNLPVATLNGQPIYDADLEPMIHSQLLQLKSQEYRLKSQALEAVIQGRLLEAEAKKKGLTADKLIEQEVQSKVKDPTDAEIKAVYDSNKAALNRPLTELRDQIRASLKRVQAQSLEQSYQQGLRTQADVKINLTAPDTQLAYDPARLRGNPNASVTIIEFSDYQCPYCKAAEPTLKQVLAKYGDKVRLSYRDLPLREIHPNAQGAAEAARCAGEQGKFWEYHDSIFEDTLKTDAAGLREKAHGIGLDQKLFDACVASRKYQAQVQSDLEMGSAAGVTGTPGFFINGVLLSGAQPLAAFEQVINAELAKVALK